MALVGETLYVADTENHLLRTVDLQSRTVKRLAGTGKQSQERAPGGLLRSTALNSPWDLLHHDGVLYVAMAGPHQIWKHVLGSDTIRVFAGSGREDIIDGPRDTCALAQPSGLATDGEQLYFVDSEGSAVRQVPFSGDGDVTTIVGAHDLERGRSLFEFGDIDGVSAKARFQHPIGIAWHDGQLYVADTYNHKIKRIDPVQRTSETWLGTGEPGASLSPVQLFEPAGATAADGVLYVADTNNHRILAVDLESGAAREFVVSGLTPPAPIDVPPPQVAAGDVLDVPAQRIKSGDTLIVRIAFELPEGFKLNQLGPVTYTLTAVGEQTLIAGKQFGVRAEAVKGEADATIAVPLAAQSGAGTYELSLSYTFCRDGTGGVCRFAKQAWRVPVELAADAAGEATLTASPQSQSAGVRAMIECNPAHDSGPTLPFSPLRSPYRFIPRVRAKQYSHS
jgi:sugar lactone lactonase YvrE